MRKINKKSQLKIQEMSFMLLALILFFVIAGLFYISLSASGLKKQASILQQEQAITLISKLANSPELSCGKSLCIDVDKLLVLKDRKAYQGFWDIEGLRIMKVYPYPTQEIECNAGNYDKCTVFTIKELNQSYLEEGTFVSLCRKETKDKIVYDKCEIGKILGGIKIRQ